ncbi:MAG TPA: DoxX family protein [Candidatus Limnocylindrales bacterium]|nr:DoxX family protein [Candidatus Limnocylindrales bacterium]
MKSWLHQYSDEAYALLRIVAGLMFLFHGVQKIFGVMTEFIPPFGSQIWIGGIIELVGGLAVMIGFRTRIAAFLCSGMMAVAYIQFHWMLQLDSNFFPAINKGEPAVLYCFVFLLIACRGAVKWGMDPD